MNISMYLFAVSIVFGPFNLINVQQDHKYQWSTMAECEDAAARLMEELSKIDHLDLSKTKIWCDDNTPKKNS